MFRTRGSYVDDDTSEPQTAAKVTRGRRYPGANLDDIIGALRLVDAAGGTISVGRLAVRVGKSETSSAFERLTTTMVNFGVVQWQGKGHAMLEITDAGRAALGEDPEAKSEALRRAFVRPDVYAQLARKFRGRALAEDDVTEGFLAAGVAPERAARNAAQIFTESAKTSGAAHEEGGKTILDGDLTLPDADVAAAPRVAAATVAGRRADPSRDAGVKVKLDPIPDAQQTEAGAKKDTRDVPPIAIHLDVSGWEVDAVVELVRRLREPPAGA